MSDFKEQATKLVGKIAWAFDLNTELSKQYDPFVSAIAKALEEAREEALVVVYSKDERISELEATVAKAFLALGEVAEVLVPVTKQLNEDREKIFSGIDDEESKRHEVECWFSVFNLRRAKAFRERIMDLCHSDPVSGGETSSLRSSNEDGDVR